MRFTKFSPFAEQANQQVQHLVDELFSRSIGDLVGSDQAFSRPAVNITEHDDAFIIALAAPGKAKSDFKVSVEKDQLTITATKTESTEGEPKPRYTLREFNYAQFKRSFRLPETVSTDDIAASYENGILTLRLRKITPAVTVKTVEIL